MVRKINQMSRPLLLVAMLQMISGFWISRAIYIVAKLGLVDLMLAAAAGFKLTRIVPTLSPMSVVEAERLYHSKGK